MKIIFDEELIEIGKVDATSNEKTKDVVKIY